VGTRFSVTGRDVVATEVVIAVADMTLAIATVAEEVAILVGDNINTGEFRMQVDRSIQEVMDVLREAQWPEGALATNSASELTVLIGKPGVIVANAADIPAASLSESSIVLAHGGISGGGQGSSAAYQVAFDKLRRFIRESLSDG